MGIYADLQKDLGKAFATDLADAVHPITFISFQNEYDESTMVSTQVEVPVTKNCAVTGNTEGEELNQDTLNNHIELIMLDEERDTLSFFIEMVIKFGSDTFTLVSFEPDPSFATWTIIGRRLG